jgi:toxin YoeB
MKKNWEERAWNDYLYWQKHDKGKVNRINALLKDIERHPFDGIGSPEPLKYDLGGWWSRQIDLEHRIVYRVANGIQIDIMSCYGHYE